MVVACDSEKSRTLQRPLGPQELQADMGDLAKRCLDQANQVWVDQRQPNREVQCAERPFP